MQKCMKISVKKVLSLLLVVILMIPYFLGGMTASAASYHNTYLRVCTEDRGAYSPYTPYRQSKGVWETTYDVSNSITYIKESAMIYGSIASYVSDLGTTDTTIAKLEQCRIRQVVGSGSTCELCDFDYGDSMFPRTGYYIWIRGKVGDVFEVYYPGSRAPSNITQRFYNASRNYLVIGKPDSDMMGAEITGYENDLDSQGKIDLATTKEVQLEATVSEHFADMDKDIYWSTDNSRIASVNQNGKLTVHNPGKVKVTAKVVLDAYPFISGKDSVDLPIRDSANPAVERISVSGTKYPYWVDGEFVEQGTIKVYYDDGSSKEVPLLKEHVSQFDTATSGKKKATVTYEGQTTTFPYEVSDAAPTNLEISGQTTSFLEGSPFDYVGTLTATYEDGTEVELDLDDPRVTITGFDSSKLGSQTITVEFRGMMVNYEIGIQKSGKDIVITNVVQVNGYDANMSVNYQGNPYVPGEGSTELEFGYSKTDDPETVDNWQPGLTFSSVPAGVYYFFAREKEQTTAVSQGYEKEIVRTVVSITVRDPVEDYEQYDRFKPGGKVDVLYDDGTKTTLPLEEKMLVNFNTNTIGTWDVQVSYGSAFDDYPIHVTARKPVDKVLENLYIKDEPIHGYVVGDSFKDGGTVLATYSDGSGELVDITSDIVTGFDSDSPGKKEATVTYEGKTVTYLYEVIDPETTDGVKIIDVTRDLNDYTVEAWDANPDETLSTMFNYLSDDEIEKLCKTAIDQNYRKIISTEESVKALKDKAKELEDSGVYDTIFIAVPVYKGSSNKGEIVSSEWGQELKPSEIGCWNGHFSISASSNSVILVPSQLYLYPSEYFQFTIFTDTDEIPDDGMIGDLGVIAKDAHSTWNYNQGKWTNNLSTCISNKTAGNQDEIIFYVGSTITDIVNGDYERSGFAYGSSDSGIMCSNPNPTEIWRCYIGTYEHSKNQIENTVSFGITFLYPNTTFTNISVESEKESDIKYIKTLDYEKGSVLIYNVDKAKGKYKYIDVIYKIPLAHSWSKWITSECYPYLGKIWKFPEVQGLGLV